MGYDKESATHKEGLELKRTRVALGSITTERGVFEGVIKMYRDLEPAAKEARILERFASANPNLPVARLHAYEQMSGSAFEAEGWKYLLAESQVDGPQLVDDPHPISLSEARKASVSLFDELTFVSEDPILNSEGIAYCGDLSSTNIRETEAGDIIVDWSAVYTENTAHVTPRYAPPEVIKGVRPMEVNADIWGLGAVLARKLLGRDKFRSLFPDEGRHSYLKSSEVQNFVPDEVKEFFKVTLAEDPYDRVLPGVESPGENYRRLKRLFLGEQ